MLMESAGLGVDAGLLPDGFQLPTPLRASFEPLLALPRGLDPDFAATASTGVFSLAASSVGPSIAAVTAMLRLIL